MWERKWCKGEWIFEYFVDINRTAIKRVFNLLYQDYILFLKFFPNFSYLCGTITCSQLLLIIQFTFVCLQMSIPSSEWVSLNPFFIGSFFCSKTWNPISCFCSLQNGLLSSTISWLPYTSKVPLYTNTRFKKFFFYTRVNVGQFFLLVTTI